MPNTSAGLAGPMGANKLVVIMVGLPGRGKTYLCNKLMCYLNWLGHESEVFNVGCYRRNLKAESDSPDHGASFFDPNNQEGLKVRQQALHRALDALMDWLTEAPEHEVAFFDATNTTNARRQFLVERFQDKVQYVFLENICDDPDILESNIQLKLMHSADYANMSPVEARADFTSRIREYEKVYEPVTDGKSNRHLPFIQLVNIITGCGRIDVNRISGYLPSKMLFYLTQVSASALNTNRRIWLSRPGEVQLDHVDRLGVAPGFTAKGDKYAPLLARALCARAPVKAGQLVASCWTGTLPQSTGTARCAPFAKVEWEALEDARAGESTRDLLRRVEPLVIELERQSESVCIIAHEAILRCVYAYLMQVPHSEIEEGTMPLHTLIELEPCAGGAMIERRHEINIASVTDADLFASSTEGARGLSPPGPRNAGTPCYHPARIAHQTSIQAANRHSTFDRCQTQGSLPQPLGVRMPAQPASPLSPLAANLRGALLLDAQGGAAAATQTSPLAVQSIKGLSVPTIPEHPEPADAAGAWPSDKNAPQMRPRGSEDTDASTASDWGGRDLLVREASSRSADQPTEAEVQTALA